MLGITFNDVCALMGDDARHILALNNIVPKNQQIQLAESIVLRGWWYWEALDHSEAVLQNTTGDLLKNLLRSFRGILDRTFRKELRSLISSLRTRSIRVSCSHHKSN